MVNDLWRRFEPVFAALQRLLLAPNRLLIVNLGNHDLFRSRRRLEVENLFLRHLLNIALRRAPHRLRLRGSDRALLAWMTWLWPSLLDCPASRCTSSATLVDFADVPTWRLLFLRRRR